MIVFFFQAEDGIRDLVRSRGLGDVYKRQVAFVVQGVGAADAGQRQQRLGEASAAGEVVRVERFEITMAQNRVAPPTRVAPGRVVERAKDAERIEGRCGREARHGPTPVSYTQLTPPTSDLV